jgi:hypothetical protein
MARVSFEGCGCMRYIDERGIESDSHTVSNPSTGGSTSLFPSPRASNTSMNLFIGNDVISYSYILSQTQFETPNSPREIETIKKHQTQNLSLP